MPVTLRVAKPIERAYLLRQRGLSIVELMIGITVGLFIVAAASVLTTNQLSDNRRLMLETQVQQELRAAMDLVVRDLRRTDYWTNSLSSVWSPQNPVPGTSDLVAIDIAPNTPVSRLLYDYSLLDGSGNAGAGFELSDHALRLRLGGMFQPITDPATLTVTAFTITLQQQTIDLGSYCVPRCVPSAGGVIACPRQIVRQFNVLLAGQAVFDPTVQRNLRAVVRLPNDTTSGACPSPP